MSDLFQNNRRILSVWFPRMGAERLLRKARGAVTGPLAVVSETGNMQVLCSLSAEAEAAGVRLGQPLRDALAMCPHLATHKQVIPAEAVFLGHLRRWAGKYSPWASETDPDALALDITGCAHLFGGEEGLLEAIENDCARFGLTVRLGLADTLGAAWALSHYCGESPTATRSGDAIDQEAYATRARAVKRRNWEKGGAAPKVSTLTRRQTRIAPPGQTRQAIGMLPLSALRIDDKTVTELNRVGLRRIEDVLNQPRAPVQRRFGTQLGLRLDQIVGTVGEPISPARPPLNFSCRMTLPDPIGLEDDVMAALDRMLPTLSRRLSEASRGARALRLEAYRADGTMQVIEVGLARPASSPDRMRPLLAMKMDALDAGFGIDMLRLVVTVHEHVKPEQHRRLPSDRVPEERSEMDDLIGRIGARVGLDAITRLHPASSHIPEKTSQVVMAAFAPPNFDWQVIEQPRPLIMFDPELVTPPEGLEQVPRVPDSFRWRGRRFEVAAAEGPERIAPEWWLDERAWRTGTRDYWRVMTTSGARLWLYFAHGGAMTGGWFCQGQFG